MLALKQDLSGVPLRGGEHHIYLPTGLTLIPNDHFPFNMAQKVMFPWEQDNDRMMYHIRRSQGSKSRKYMKSVE